MATEANPGAKYERTLALMRRRWPGMSARLEHPLAEVFMARAGRQRWWRRYYRRNGASPILLIVLFLFINIIGLLIYLLINGALRSRGRGGWRRLVQPAQLFCGDRQRLHDVWMTGVHYEDLAAIEVALALGAPMRQPVRFLAFMVANLIGWIAVISIYEVAPGSIWLLLAVMLLVNVLLALAMSADTVAQRALRELRMDLRQRCYGKVREAIGNSFLGCGVILAVVCGLGMVIGPSIELLQDVDGAVVLRLISSLLTAIAVGVGVFMIKYNPRRTEVLFEDHLTVGDETIQEIIQQEADLASMN